MQERCTILRFYGRCFEDRRTFCEIPNSCPICGSDNIERLARVTGYLTTDVSHFNKGKQDEVARRYKHSKSTFNDC